MNWDDFINKDFRTINEVEQRHLGKREMFDTIAAAQMQQIENKRGALIKQFGSVENIPILYKGQLNQHLEHWINKWGINSALSKSLNEEAEAEFGKKLNGMYRYQQAEEQAKENVTDFEQQNKIHKTASLLSKQEQQSEDIGSSKDLELEQFIKSIQEAKERNRDKGFERQPS